MGNYRIIFFQPDSKMSDYHKKYNAWTAEKLKNKARRHNLKYVGLNKKQLVSLLVKYNKWIDRI